MERSFIKIEKSTLWTEKSKVASPIIFCVCILFYLLMFSISYAEDPPPNLTCAERIALTHFTTGKLSLLFDDASVRFPLNFLQAGYNLLDSMSSMNPVSPAGMSLTIFGINFTPLSFMGSSVFDVLFAGIRIMMLAFIILSVVKHVIEVIL